MPTSFSQLHVHLVTAVHYRAALIQPAWQEKLHQYITGIVRGKGQRLIQINTMPDHMHALIGMRPSLAPSDLIRDIKSNSSKWINDQGFCAHRFEWQDGFALFSVSKDRVPVVARYIENQQRHHLKKGFLDEFRELLIAEGLEFDPKYLFYEPR